MNKTIRLFDQDAYKTEFEATVLACEPGNNGFWVTLDQTLFFPEEGGQKPDIGELEKVDVLDVQIKDGVIHHLCQAPLPVGACVKGRIDFARRFRQMQNHSGEHIVSGLFHSLYGLENVGFHLGLAEMTIDLSSELGRAELDRVEQLANEVIYKDLPITAEYVPSHVLSTLSYRSKLALTEDVRIVTIPGVDVCACCAPHVRRTGEIGLIKLLDFMRYKGGIRIFLHCGSDALFDYRSKYTAVAHIASKLSLKQQELIGGFDRFYDDYQSRGLDIYRLKCRLAQEKAKTLAKTDKPLCLFEDEYDAVFLKEYANAAWKKHGGTVCVCARKENGYAYLLHSDLPDLKQKAQQMHTALCGRGGGKAPCMQGFFAADEQQIRDFFAEF